MNTVKQFCEAASKQKDVYPKALANFIFREVIENAHTKYNISQEDMRAMCQDAVNRAALFLDIQNTKMYEPFAMYALPALKWNDADTENEFAQQFFDTLKMFYEEE